MNVKPKYCAQCNVSYSESGCPECWTRCQTCDRGLHRENAVSIHDSGPDCADFCIQCAHNISYIIRETKGSVLDVIFTYAREIKPFVDHLGMTEVIRTANTRKCLRCGHRIVPQDTCCFTCKRAYYMEAVDPFLIKVHAVIVLDYIGADCLR